LIEVNLLPGGKKRSAKGRGLSLSALSLPKFGGGGGGGALSDPYIVSAVGAGVLTLAVVGFLFFSVRGAREDTQVALDAAVQDSVRFADLIRRTNQLTARRDSIAQRVGIIQQIDAGRYIWSHVMDEVGRALPDYTWLREVVQSGTDPLQIRISGRAGNNYAITRFMQNLEASRFLRNVQLERSEQMQSEQDRRDIVYEFALTVSYDQPPLGELETVPLFESEPGGNPAADTSGAPAADTTRS
jgi:Tfp pilus assembly protein PilN